MKKNLREMIENIDQVKVLGDVVTVAGDMALYPLPLVDGNEKIGKGVWHASTLPGDEIITLKNGDQEKGTCPLKCAGCYGLSGFYTYDSTKKALMMRTRFLKRYPEIYFRIAEAQIIAENIKLIRVHATGDFIPGEAAGWTAIFKKHPDLIGWTYTKCSLKGEVKKLDMLHNFNIVKSIIPGCGFNFGHIDYIMKIYDKLVKAGKNVHVCRCGIDRNQHCNTCKGCAINEYVLFIEHGTSYNAEKDPLYDQIKELIENQDDPGTFESFPDLSPVLAC